MIPNTDFRSRTPADNSATTPSLHSPHVRGLCPAPSGIFRYPPALSVSYDQLSRVCEYPASKYHGGNFEAGGDNAASFTQ
jgi:hypothetical protein